MKLYGGFIYALMTGWAYIYSLFSRKKKDDNMALVANDCGDEGDDLPVRGPARRSMLKQRRADNAKTDAESAKIERDRLVTKFGIEQWFISTLSVPYDEITVKHLWNRFYRVSATLKTKNGPKTVSSKFVTYLGFKNIQEGRIEFVNQKRDENDNPCEVPEQPSLSFEELVKRDSGVDKSGG